MSEQHRYPTLPPHAHSVGHTPGEHWPEVLRQVAQMMRNLTEKGETGNIDLQGLQLSQSDLLQLREKLGEGEIAFDFGDEGTIDVRETAHAGVWWITYHNMEGDVIAEFLEVSYCPDAMIVTPDDVRDSMEALLAHMFDTGMRHKQVRHPLKEDD